MRKSYVLLIVLFVPEILAALFFAVSYGISPRSAGESLSVSSGIPYPAVMAHRGASHLAPEETAPAYILAREIGADYLEMDVQRTKDGVLIALHDDTLERTTNIATVYPDRAKNTVDTFTYAELQKLDAGSWFNEKTPDLARDSYRGLRILKLSEIIDIAEKGENKPGLYIETKSPERYPGVERDIVSLLKERGWLPLPETSAPAQSPDGRIQTRLMRGRVVLQSFAPESLARMKELAPDVFRIYLVGQEEAAKLGGWDKVLEDATRIANGIGPVGYLAYPWYSGPAHRKNLLIHPYTIDKTWQMWLIRQFGADGIFTNNCETAVVFYNRRHSVNIAEIFKKTGY